NFYEIIAFVSFFLQEIQNSVDIQTAFSEGSESVIIQVLQMYEGNPVIIFLHCFKRISAACRKMSQIRADFNGCFRKQSVYLLRSFRHGSKMRMITCLDTVFREYFRSHIQAFSKQMVV